MDEWRLNGGGGWNGVVGRMVAVSVFVFGGDHLIFGPHFSIGVFPKCLNHRSVVLPNIIHKSY